MNNSKISYLIFRTRDSLWAFDSCCIHETILLPELKCIAEMPAHVAGYLNYHQNAITVIDLNYFLGYPKEPFYKLYDYIVLIRESGSLFGFLISDIIGINQVNVSPTSSDTGKNEENALPVKLVDNITTGIFQGEMVFIFDPQVVIKEVLSNQEFLDFKTDSSKQFSVRPEDKLIFSERAYQLAREIKKIEKTDNIDLIIVRYNQEYFGVHPENVKEFTDVVHYTPIPLAPPHFIGFMNLRGVILPLIDIWKIIGFPSIEIKNATKVLIINCDGFNLGVLVDDILNISTFSSGEVKSNPLNVKHVHEPYVKSTIQYQNSVIGVLDLMKIIESVQLTLQE